MPWYKALGYPLVVIDAVFGFLNFLRYMQTFAAFQRDSTPENHVEMAWVLACSAWLLAFAALLLAWLK